MPDRVKLKRVIFVRPTRRYWFCSECFWLLRCVKALSRFLCYRHVLGHGWWLKSSWLLVGPEMLQCTSSYTSLLPMHHRQHQFQNGVRKGNRILAIPKFSCWKGRVGKNARDHVCRMRRIRLLDSWGFLIFILHTLSTSVLITIIVNSSRLWFFYARGVSCI